jgi:hypothetical protein
MDKKISQLTAAAPLTGTEVLPVVQSGQTVKTTIDDILNAESITYAQATALMGSGGLTPGKSYLLSDFQTVHYIVDGSGNTDITTIITGAVEPLVLKAASTTKFDPVASSTTFPQDIIHVDLNPNNWLEDLSFADVYGTGDIVPGFKGVITYREDTKNMNIFRFDFRNCKFRRWKLDSPAWSALTTYNEGDTVLYSFGSEIRIYYAKVTNTNNDPTSFPDVWVGIVDCKLSLYLSSAPVSLYTTLIVDPLDYVDVKMFVENGASGTYELSVLNNNFTGAFKDNGDYYDYVATILPNTVIYLADSGYYNMIRNNFSGFMFANTISNCDYFADNTFLGNFTFNTVSGRDFQSNVFNKEYKANITGIFFQRNYIHGDFFGNIIGDSVLENILGQCNGNLISDYFIRNSLNVVAGNKFRYYFQQNVSNSTLDNCTFYLSENNAFLQSVSGLTTNSVNTFQNNVFATPSPVILNLSSATHVYQNYTCTISRKPDGTFALSYINNANTQLIVAATS